MNTFGSRRIYYNNFAEHLLNVFNPNMTYPDKENRWKDDDWRKMMDMIADCGFNIFEFWLTPRLFCREALKSDFLHEYLHQIHVAADAAHRRGVKIEMLCGLVTVGSDWMSLCPNVPEEWEEIRFLWKSYASLMDCVDIFSIFPGDPGCCSRNGCTAITYIDRSIEISHLIQSVHPGAEIDFNTWGSPFFGWGILEGPENWHGEFVQSYQATAWRFDAKRCRESMEHLLKRAKDFAQPCVFSVNMGFNPDGIPKGEEDGRPWARKLAEQAEVLTWDFSLTEGENGIFPHYRFPRLFSQRRKEREAGCYSGGICYTMTPRLNSLSLYEAAHSFMDSDADYDALAREFYEKAFGPGGGELVQYLPLFEVVPDWGNHCELHLTRQEYHRKMTEFVEKLTGWQNHLKGSLKIYPDAETNRSELEFFARLFAGLSAENPDYDMLAERYWKHVYSIYDTLPEHVDPRPRMAVSRLIEFFRNYDSGIQADKKASTPAPGEWVKKENDLMNEAAMKLVDELAGRQFHLRKLTAQDAPGLVDFYSRLSNRSRELFTPHEFDLETLKGVCAEFAKEEHEVAFVLTDTANRIAAYFFLWDTNEPVPELGIAIADEFHGRGIGKLLIRLLIEIVRVLGKKKLRLTTGIHNDNAFALYTKCGFVYTGIIEIPNGPGGKPFLQKELFYSYE